MPIPDVTLRMTLAELSDALGLALEGDADLEIHGLAGLADAGPGDLTFVTGPAYEAAFQESKASAFLLPLGFDARGRTCLRSAQPYPDFGRIVDLLMPEEPAPVGAHPTAVVAETARVSPEASIGPYAVIGARSVIGPRTRIEAHASIGTDCSIGADARLYAGARIGDRVQIGDRVVICSAAVIGSPGFGFAYEPGGRRVRTPHRAGVVIEDDAEIGAGSTIDASHPAHPHDAQGRASTRIGRGVKIDDQVHVAHGCEVDDGSTLCAGVGLAGRTRIGKNVFLAGGAMTSGDLRVNDGAVVLGMSGVMSDVEAGAQVVGQPVMPRRDFFRMQAALKKLPELLKTVRRMQKSGEHESDD